MYIGTLICWWQNECKAAIYLWIMKDQKLLNLVHLTSGEAVAIGERRTQYINQQQPAMYNSTLKLLIIKAGITPTKQFTCLFSQLLLMVRELLQGKSLPKRWGITSQIWICQFVHLSGSHIQKALPIFETLHNLPTLRGTSLSDWYLLNTNFTHITIAWWLL